MTVADNILRFYQSLKPPTGLPSTVEVMNPYKDEQAMELCTSFYQKYYDDHNPRIVLFGINPGRFGGGITGVPFSDPDKLASFCELPNPFEKRKELSSGFIYEIIQAFGGAICFLPTFLHYRDFSSWLHSAWEKPQLL